MTTIIITGLFLSAYAFNPTYGTLKIRQEWGQLPADVSEYDVLLAVPNCDLIGRDATMRVGGVDYDALIFDCAGPGSHTWMIDNHVAAEVDYWFWREHPELIGVRSPVTIKVYLN